MHCLALDWDSASGLKAIVLRLLKITPGRYGKWEMLFVRTRYDVCVTSYQFETNEITAQLR